ncbi:SAM-dependent methyltransferase [Patescibacteria group bacterium]|nr:SAM-dependent methyltransferase [Patescibacteria group bacterium]MCL5010003.1 SAM-dependent methyltransferase [Patescibacteria group bacterium]
MGFIIFNILLISLVVFLLIVLSWIWPPDSPWAPWWKTDKKTARIMCELAGVSRKDTVYDLGCGDATALRVAAGEFGAKGVGIEIDPLRTIIAILIILIIREKKRVVIKRKNFFDEDLSPATVVFVYLVPKVLSLLLPKFKKELTPGTRIVSYRYKMDLPPVKSDTKNKIYIYKII